MEKELDELKREIATLKQQVQTLQERVLKNETRYGGHFALTICLAVMMIVIVNR